MPLDDKSTVDALFRSAVGAIDAGDLASLRSLLAAHPGLADRRLESPGAWLRDSVGGALDGFFHRPYLLWFVAEDPVRNGRLPSNIAESARAIIEYVRGGDSGTLQEQLDYALQLVAWSIVARDSGVQLDLLDVLIDAGASTHAAADNALVNANFAAARHLLERGAAPTLASSLCLDQWEDAKRLATDARPAEKQFALVLAALRGNAEAIRRLLGFGVDVNARSESLFSHGTPLHHAAGSGSLEAVRVLVDAGAILDVRDTVYNGTPLGWAEYAHHREIAAYLRGKMS